MKKVIIKKGVYTDCYHWSGPAESYDMIPVIDEKEDIDDAYFTTIGILYLDRGEEDTRFSPEDFYVTITKVSRIETAENGDDEEYDICIDARVDNYKASSHTIKEGEFVIRTTVYHYKDGNYERIKEEE